MSVPWCLRPPERGAPQVSVNQTFPATGQAKPADTVAGAPAAAELVAAADVFFAAL